MTACHSIESPAIAEVILAVLLVTMFGTMPYALAANDQQVLHDAAVNYFEQMPTNKHIISVDGLKKLVDAHDENIYIVDIRDHKDFEQRFPPQVR